MIEFNIREKLALRLVRKTKWDDKKMEFVNCRYNDFIFNFVAYVLRVNPYELLNKVKKAIDELEGKKRG